MVLCHDTARARAFQAETVLPRRADRIGQPEACPGVLPDSDPCSPA